MDLNTPRWRQYLLPLTQTVITERGHSLVCIPDRTTAECELEKLRREYSERLVRAVICKVQARRRRALTPPFRYFTRRHGNCGLVLKPPRFTRLDWQRFSLFFPFWGAPPPKPRRQRRSPPGTHPDPLALAFTLSRLFRPAETRVRSRKTDTILDTKCFSSNGRKIVAEFS